jgi:hypothetical protein
VQSVEFEGDQLPVPQALQDVDAGSEYVPAEQILHDVAPPVPL